MSILSTILGLMGFAWGVGIGSLIGYFLFIYTQPSDVKDPIIRPISELDSKSLTGLLPEIPIWVKNPDCERVEWLNKLVKDLWPFLDKAICKIVREQTKPYFEEYGPKFKLESVEFEKLTLGSLPPTFPGIKVYLTKEREVIIEPCLKFAGNPNVVLAVKAFGLKLATVQLVDVQVFATPRVTLRPLMDTLPCFSKINVCLMDKPHVDFGLKLLGGDLMAIPGLYKLVQDIIKEQVASMYLWPKNLEIIVVEETAASKQQPVGILTVKVVRANGLKKKDLIGKSDPFTKVQLVGVGYSFSKTTRTLKSNLNPEWNESFKLVVKDPSTQTLEVHVYDWERIGSHELMGMQVISLKDLVPEETKFLTLDLLKSMDPNDLGNQKSRGNVTLELMYKPFNEDESCDVMQEEEIKESEKAPEGTPEGGGLLMATILEAEEVEGKHHTNPFARALFRGEEKRTKSIKKTKDPKWGQTFEWVVNEPPTAEHLHVEVMSKNYGFNMHLKESLGYVDINLADVINKKKINETYPLTDSKNGKVHLELVWRPA